METVFQPLMDWIKDAIKDTLKKLLDLEKNDDGYPELMDVSTTCDFLGIEYMTFSSKYRHLEGFPKELPAKRWSKRAIKKWLEQQI
ncbi:DNA-binding protein [Streptococcus pluranimalium]|uniref:DNA-binding protein n=1 Tax=Streptococcus pluranimalium TaxID=82348 RepID=A0A345VIG1_9STRE|nr:DNA-binding protein [Streptococcus pluranimalium]AXJ12473.1 hypothetical protein Sp14A_05430 [Streptococcus pluranimalium]AXJ12513.1 hypothetical protein Sp14A_05830 [Streptococcus pluranimalium]